MGRCAVTTSGSGGLHLDDNARATLNVGANIFAGNVVIDSGASLTAECNLKLVAM